MRKALAENSIKVPEYEYRILKEIYKTVKRQQFLLRCIDCIAKCFFAYAKKTPLT